ncbi:MAG: hypothetical protein V1909_05755 [Candidatus Micrarchaeota archaeon]
MNPKSIRKAILHYNASKKEALEAKDEIIAFLTERGVEVEERHNKKLATWGESKIPHFKYSDRSSRASFKMGDDAKMLLQFKGRLTDENAGMLITLGGDGTLLFYKGLYNLPIFAIGSKTSYLCQARMDNWEPKLAYVLKNCETKKHPTLQAKFGAHLTEPAMNEICVKNPRHRMLRFVLKVKGKEYRFGADGVIFSTALGSSGYAYSAGGSEFVNSKNYELVPVAPHRRLLKPMFASIDAPAELKILSRYRHDVVDVVVDGQLIYEMGLNASLIVMKSKKEVSMFKVKK